MNKKGIVLIFGLIVVLVLTILSASIYSKSINESNLSKRHVESIRAFWLAEAGVAETVDKLPTPQSGYIGNATYKYSTSVNQTNSTLYEITSTGSVEIIPTKEITRVIKVNVKTSDVSSSNFKYAIETTTDLVIKGASVDINPDPPENYQEEDSTLDFQALFGCSKAEMKSNADHLYTPSTFDSPIDGITWVDVPTGNTFNITGNYTGSGILVVSGNVKFAGDFVFDGIIYVIGELTIIGNVTASGSVLAESSTEVDTTIQGSVILNWDDDKIDAALNEVRFLTKNIVSWQEIP